MKKILLLAAAAMVAASASAEALKQAADMNGVDVTPAGYKFNTYDKEFIGFPDINGTAGSAPWQLGNNWYKNYASADGFSFGDGLIGVSGPFFTGGNYKKGNYEALTAATKIIDMGGTCGKVLCMNFTGEAFPAKYKELTGSDLEIGDASGLGYAIPNFWLAVGELAKHMDAGSMPFRIRMEINIYAPDQASNAEVWKTFAQNDEGNVLPFEGADNEAGDIMVKPSEFAYRWCEKDESDPDDDSTWDEEGDAEWNPNRWLVYEWDFSVPAGGEDGPANVKLKNEMPASVKAVLIRSINVYVPEDADREYIVKKRPRTWNYYTVGAPASVESVAVEADALTYTVNGEEVTFSAAAKVYNMAGAMVAEGTTVTLAHGVYVAQAGGKTVKIAVK